MARPASPEQIASTFEVFARERKALAIVHVLERYTVTSHEAEFASEAEWELAAKVADVKLPSPATRDVVVQLMRSREVTPDLIEYTCPHCGTKQRVPESVADTCVTCRRETVLKSCTNLMEERKV